jgi:hypothetical protein
MVIAVEQVTDESIVVVAKSDFSGRITHREIEIQLEKFEKGMDAWNNGKLIQKAFPDLSASDREFIKSGITDEEWNEMFFEMEDEDEN